MSNRQQLSEFYQQRKDRFAAELSHIEKEISRISNLCIAIAIAILGVIYLASTSPGWIYVTFPVIAFFVYLVYRHDKLFVRSVHLANLVKLNHAEVQSLNGDFSTLSSGDEFIDTHHPYSYDLDIFGDGSVFQLINRCNTFRGKQSLADRLARPLPSAGDIRSHQRAVAELNPRVDFRQNLAAASLEAGEAPGDREQLLSWLKTSSFVYGRPYMHVLLWVLPAVTISAVVLFLAGYVPQIVPLSLVFTQWIIYGLYNKRVNVFHDYISRKKMILEKYSAMLDIIRAQSFDTSPLKDIHERASDAGLKVHQLARLVSNLNARLNFLTTLFVNSLLMYDLQCVYRLEKWKHYNGSRLDQWLNAISEVEVFGSFANFAHNHPHCNFPDITEKLLVDAEGLGHPLLRPEECITNAVAIGPAPSVHIVTGANMAGKSTFLRALGVNLVLALAGAPVYARRFSCPLIPLRSGMRTADSLKDHASYFYAELNRLKAIMDELRQGNPLFILLDEILKGTNSTDKQKGSIALVLQLVEQPCLCVVATHDLALGELAGQHPGAIKNYCFEASIVDDRLSFDYTLKEGVAHTMNASFLMKKMGIVR